MKILLIYAYPNHEGLNHAIKEQITNNINRKNELKEIDLYQENFDPVLHFDSEYRRRDLHKDPSTEKYRDLVAWADFYIFVYPIWWYSMPAILKGFIDRVFAKDFAYKYKGVAPLGLLKGRRAWVINTHDTPGFYARFFQGDYGRVLSRQILKFCGIKTVRHSTLSYVRGAKPAKIERFLQKIAQISKRL